MLAGDAFVLFFCILKNLPLHQAGSEACWHWTGLGCPLSSFPTPQHCYHGTVLSVGPSAYTRVIVRKGTMKFILASALRMWSRLLFVRSHGVLLSIVVSRRVTIALSDFSSGLWEVPAQSQPVQAHLEAPMELQPRSSPLLFPTMLSLTFNLCSLFLIFYTLGNLKSLFGGEWSGGTSEENLSKTEHK